MSETTTIETRFLKNLWDDARGERRWRRARSSCSAIAPTCSAPTCASPTSAAATPARNSTCPTRSPASRRGSWRSRAAAATCARSGTSGFAILYLDKLERLIARYRGEAFEDEMVGFYPLCAFGENRVAASIDTPLHAFLPFDHVDHLHPDWAIALAASANGEAKMEEFNKKYGRKIIWVPWQRPGFELALMLKRAVEANPGCDGLILGGHGLFTWGDTQKECYLNSVRTIDQMGEFVQDHRDRSGAPLFGGAKVTATVAGSRSRGHRAVPVAARRGVVEPPRDRPLRRQRRRDSVRQLALGRGALPDGHELSRITSCAPGSRRCSFPGSPAKRRSPRSRIGSPNASASTVRTTAPTTRRSPSRRRRSCATATRRSWSSRASGCSASARTSAKRGSRPSSSSTRST